VTGQRAASDPGGSCTDRPPGLRDAANDDRPGADDGAADAPLELGAPELVGLFDALVDVMFCAKDVDHRYVAVNGAFVRRTGRRSRREVLGARAVDLFPAPLAERYESQDRRVLQSGRPLHDEVELIRRPDGSEGWYVTTKLPVVRDGVVSGLVSVSRDLHRPSDDVVEVASLSRVVDLVRQRLDEPLRTADLAAAAGCSTGQLTRRLRRVFGLSPTQFLLRARVDRATTLLSGTDTPIAEVATACGFYDQAAFTRQFARLTGDTPAQYRARHTTLRSDTGRS
jgi:PAS domain S-box-containing protein